MSDKITIKKVSSRSWEWSIDRGTDHLAGGFASTKAAAENDSGLAAAFADQWGRSLTTQLQLI